MSTRIKCFWLEPTDRAEVSIRRYYGWDKVKNECSGHYGYHNADVALGEVPDTNRAISVTEEMKKEPQWPKKCDYCDYLFTDDDQWQWNEHTLYKRSDNGEKTILRKAPVGAMYDAFWYKGHQGFKVRPDGIILCVMTPGGDWVVDGPSNNGNGWERTGVPPLVTASPSILMTRYHGWLRNGELEEC